MQFLPVAALLSLAVAVSANFVHIIEVGNQNGQTIYTPNDIQANPGEFVLFRFHQKNHTATQSSFDQPCTPLQHGFSSGFRPVGANQTSDFPTFVVPVLDKNPIWVHCEQGANTNASHCGMGMVASINANKQKTFDQFLQNALNVGKQLGVKPPAIAVTDTPESTRHFDFPTKPTAPVKPTLSRPYPPFKY